DRPAPGDRDAMPLDLLTLVQRWQGRIEMRINKGSDAFEELLSDHAHSSWHGALDPSGDGVTNSQLHQFTSSPAGRPDRAGQMPVRPESWLVSCSSPTDICFPPAT